MKKSVETYLVLLVVGRVHTHAHIRSLLIIKSARKSHAHVSTKIRTDRTGCLRCDRHRFHRKSSCGIPILQQDSGRVSYRLCQVARYHMHHCFDCILDFFGFQAHFLASVRFSLCTAGFLTDARCSFDNKEKTSTFLENSLKWLSWAMSKL